MIIKFRLLLKIIGRINGFKVNAITIFPFIFISYKSDRLIRHERIHFYQQLETLILLFYILYLISYLYNLGRGMNRFTAYKNIIFEKEAYRHDTDKDYHRRPYAWLGE